MTCLLALPRSLLRAFFVDWLRLYEIGDVDNAVCQHTVRNAFEMTLNGMVFENTKEFDDFHDNCIGWTILRRIALKYIYIDSIMIPEYAEAVQCGIFSHCKSLVCYRHESPLNPFYHSLFKSAPHLTDLDIEWSDFIDDVCLALIGRCCCLLKIVKLSASPIVSDIGIVALVQQCRAISSLTLCGSNNIGDSSVEEISQNLTI